MAFLSGGDAYDSNLIMQQLVRSMHGGLDRIIALAATIAPATASGSAASTSGRSSYFAPVTNVAPPSKRQKLEEEFIDIPDDETSRAADAAAAERWKQMLTMVRQRVQRQLIEGFKTIEQVAENTTRSVKISAEADVNAVERAFRTTCWGHLLSADPGTGPMLSMPWGDAIFSATCPWDTPILYLHAMFRRCPRYLVELAAVAPDSVNEAGQRVGMRAAALLAMHDACTNLQLTLGRSIILNLVLALMDVQDWHWNYNLPMPRHAGGHIECSAAHTQLVNEIFVVALPLSTHLIHTIRATCQNTECLRNEQVTIRMSPSNGVQISMGELCLKTRHDHVIRCPDFQTAVRAWTEPPHGQLGPFTCGLDGKNAQNGIRAVSQFTQPGIDFLTSDSASRSSGCKGRLTVEVEADVPPAFLIVRFHVDQPMDPKRVLHGFETRGRRYDLLGIIMYNKGHFAGLVPARGPRACAIDSPLGDCDDVLLWHDAMTRPAWKIIDGMKAIPAGYRPLEAWYTAADLDVDDIAIQDLE